MQTYLLILCCLFGLGTVTCAQTTSATATATANLTEYAGSYTFTRDATTKAVTGLTLAAQGQEITVTKDK
jgi:hypothetical protein